MELLKNLNLSPKREAMYKSILLEEEIDEAVLRLMDRPDIAEDIAEQTAIPLSVSRQLVYEATESSSQATGPHQTGFASPPECPPTSPVYTDSSSSSDESEKLTHSSRSTSASARRRHCVSLCETYTVLWTRLNNSIRSDSQPRKFLGAGASRV